jgi:N-acetylmuramoyl-L-alanine amidase
LIPGFSAADSLLFLRKQSFGMSRLSLLIIIASCAVIISCTKHPYAAANKSYKKQAKAYAKTLAATPDGDSAAPYWAGTTNFNMRKPNFVVIHHTAQDSCGQTLRTFTMTKTQVSAHYVICKDGTIHQMLNDYLRAWHAGASRWGNLTDLNSASIGIELDNNGSEPFTEAQIGSLMQLLKKLKQRHSIPAANFIGHADIAPTRKNDPNAFFPWQKLAQQGFGRWYDTTGIVLPAYFNAVQALRLVGYDVRDTSAAIRAFKLHFIQTNTYPSLTEGEMKVLFDLSGR